MLESVKIVLENEQESDVTVIGKDYGKSLIFFDIGRLQNSS